MTGRPRKGRPRLRPPSLGELTAAGGDVRPVTDGRYEGVRFERVDWSAAAAEHLEIDGSVFSHARLTDARLPSARLADVRVEASDATNAEADDSALHRVEFADSKLLGLHVGGASLRDVRFADCNLQLSSFRFAVLRRVAFIDCDLRQSSFQGAKLRDCSFAGCDLAEAQFSQSSHDGTDLRDSKLERLFGVESLRGAIVDAAQVAEGHGEAPAQVLAVDVGPRRPVPAPLAMNNARLVTWRLPGRLHAGVAATDSIG